MSAGDAPAPRPWPRPRVFKIGGRWVWRCRGHGEPPDDPGGVGDVFDPAWWGPRTFEACFAVAYKHGALYHGHGTVIEVIDP